MHDRWSSDDGCGHVGPIASSLQKLPWCSEASPISVASYPLFPLSLSLSLSCREMKRNEEEEKTDKPSTRRRILGVAAAGAVAFVAAAAGTFFLLSAIGESSGDPDETADDDPPTTRTMKAPGFGGKVMISRDKFEDNPKGFFRASRKGDEEDVGAFK